MSIISTNKDLSFQMPTANGGITLNATFKTPINFIIMDYNRDKIGYTGSVGENLVIPETFVDPDDGKLYRVVSIDSFAFKNCTSLTSINIPNSVTKIDTNAFFNCKVLTSINIMKPANSISGSPWGAPVANAVKWLG